MTSRLSILSTPKGERDVGECGLKVPAVERSAH